MNAATLIDEHADHSLLVFGSLPPTGRDLDLLVPSADVATIEKLLADNSFDSAGRLWARFVGCDVDVVEVIPASKWGLPPVEEAALFDESRPIEGMMHLTQPSPHHVLLILARRVARSGELDNKKKRRLDAAVKDDPEAWEQARHRAQVWECAEALEWLRTIYKSGDRRIPDHSQRQGRDRRRAWARSLKDHITRRRTGVIALSGLDGAGKSTQANALAASLHKLGFETAVEWTRLGHEPLLDKIALPMKRVLRRDRRIKSGSEETLDRGSASSENDRGPFITFIWSFVVALANGWSHRRATVKHLRAGRVVICDRYILDSAVHLTRKYGRATVIQIALLKLLSPRPSAAFFLDVDPESALQRKQDIYDAQRLHAHARLYRDLHTHHGVKRMDGHLPQEDLCKAIQRQAWMALLRASRFRAR